MAEKGNTGTQEPGGQNSGIWKDTERMTLFKGRFSRAKNQQVRKQNRGLNRCQAFQVLSACEEIQVLLIPG